MGLQLLGAMLGFLVLAVVLWDFFLLYIGHRQAQTAADAAAVAVGYGISPWVDEVALPKARAAMSRRLAAARRAGNQARRDYLEGWLAAHPPPGPLAPPEEQQAWEEAWTAAGEAAERAGEAARRAAVTDLFPESELVCTREAALADRADPPPGERFWLLTRKQKQEVIAQAVDATGDGPLRELAHEWAGRNGGTVQSPVQLRSDQRLEVTARRPLWFPIFQELLQGISVPARAAVTPAPQPDHSWCRGSFGG